MKLRFDFDFGEWFRIADALQCLADKFDSESHTDPSRAYTAALRDQAHKIRAKAERAHHDQFRHDFSL